MAYVKGSGKTGRTHNRLANELEEARSLGFEMHSGMMNPVLRLTDGTSLVWLAGKLLNRVSTRTYFGGGFYRIPWKPSVCNTKNSYMTTVMISPDGGTVNENPTHQVQYHRLVMLGALDAVKNLPGYSSKKVFVDHVNGFHGDEFDENLEVATARQNNLNKHEFKGAFYTLDMLNEKIVSGEWVPVAKK